MRNTLSCYFYRFQNWENDFLYFIQNRLRSRKMDAFMQACSKLGNVGFIWIILMFCMAMFGLKTLAFAIFIGLILHVLVCNLTLKKFFARSRPDLKIDFNFLAKKHKDYSFPSGHACSSFIVATVLYLAQSPIFFFAFPLACLIAFSRVYLSVHYPSDVLAGILLGFCIGYLAYSFQFASTL